MMRISPTIAKLTKFNYKPKPKWYLIDAKDKPLGRIASNATKILLGKHRPTYSKDSCVGDFVIIKNASKLVLTGKKLSQKIYFKHTGYLGGDSYTKYDKLFPHKADFILKKAVNGMLPKNKLRAKIIKRLKIFNDENIPSMSFGDQNNLEVIKC